jgi:uncharacterized cupredoxin-like copper-binding protein
MNTFAVLAGAMIAGTAWAHGDGRSASKAHTTISADEHAFGREGDPKKASRTVRIEMSDKMRFTPDRLSVKRGETVKFVVKNNGKAMHEMVIGTMKELKEHATAMKKHPAMEHEEPYMTHVAPGKTMAMVWQFTKEGTFYFGCLVPGHFEAGMIGRVEVVK